MFSMMDTIGCSHVEFLDLNDGVFSFQVDTHETDGPMREDSFRKSLLCSTHLIRNKDNRYLLLSDDSQFEVLNLTIQQLRQSDKTKEMIINPRTREKEPHRPLFIGETEVERVKTFKFLGTHISEDLTWSHNTQQILKKSQRRLYFLRRLRKFGMSTTILSCFYRCIIESVLTASITVWYGNCTTRDREALQRVIKTSQNIVGAALPSLQDIYKSRVLRRTHNLIKDSTHPQHSLFTLLPSGRRYRSLKSRTTRLANSFYPQAIRLLNEALTHATHTHSTLFICLFVCLFVLFTCINVSSVVVA
ncbi:uncharacterized protein LOC129190933 isoform X1 [Dunckerocampus dactyliophorus]|uniref:uncharacterized protein LOC129190933 isoform X1 n=1 Tax=Dunckerocampus dactyliophorus TaxID=161453 RepID=UPI002406AAA8|nr:uncharacterized protein LOC129190933 isoform X1 [Dunckerocampus dactyliophorus]